MARAFLISSFLIALIFSTPAYAQIEDPILTMPDGQAILSLSATERQDVQQDLLVATLNYISANSDRKTLQNEINTVMSKALAKAAKARTVKVSTGGYQVYEFHEPRSKEKKWRGQQSVTLKSKNAEDLLELASELQDLGLAMNELNYTLAPETAAIVQDSLMEEALKQLQDRATRAAKALGKTSAELRDINVQGNVPYPQPMIQRGMAMDMASASMAAPVAAADDTTITLTVSARAILKP